MMAVNLDGFLTVKHAVRAMVGAGNGGSIITMASVTGMAGTPLAGHYAAAKAGVINLTKTAALELRPTSVRVNAICPGFADTDLVGSQKGRYVVPPSPSYGNVDVVDHLGSPLLDGRESLMA